MSRDGRRADPPRTSDAQAAVAPAPAPASLSSDTVSRSFRIQELADLLAVRLGSAPLDHMGMALVLTLANVITGYAPPDRATAKAQFLGVLDARLQQLAQAGAETTY